MIEDDYLATLSAQERSDLDAHVEQVLQTTENVNSRVWLNWFRCQIDKELDVGRDFLRKIIRDPSLEDDERFDLTVDACCALVSLPHVSEQDLESVIAFIVNEDTDEFEAAVVLEAMLESVYVAAELKTRTKKMARKTGKAEIVDVAEQHDRCGENG